jgi:PAS domain S-box-containing protein
MIPLAIGLLLLVAGPASSDPPATVKLTPEELAFIEQHGPFRYAPDPGFPPFEFFDSRGAAVGITPDFLALIEHNLPIRFQAVRYPTWTAALMAMRKGEVDLLGTLTRTGEREGFLGFTSAYLAVPYVLFRNEAETGIERLADLMGKRLGVVRDYGGHAWLVANHPELKIVPVENTVTGLIEVSTGQLDAFLETLPVGVWVMREASLTNIRIVPDQVFETSQHFAVARGNTMLLSILDKGLLSVTAPQRTAVFLRWTGHDFSRPAGSVPPMMWRTLGVLGGVLLIVALWIFSLLKAVAVRTRALKASEERYRTVADFTYDWEYWTGPDNGIKYISPSCERITGYSVAQFNADPELLDRIVHPEDRAALKSHHREPTSSGQPHLLDIRIIRSDGQERWISHVCRMVFDERGNALGRRASNRDITERKRAEEALSRYARRLESLESISRAVLAAQSPEGVADTALERLRSLVPCERASVAVFEEDSEEAIYLAVSQSLPLGPPLGAREPIGQLYDLPRLARERLVYSPELASDTSSWLPGVQRLAQVGVRSAMIVGLVTEDRITGILNLMSTVPDAFSQEAQAIARGVAEQLAVTLHQARLRERLHIEQQRLADLIEDLPLGIAILDEGRRPVLCNGLGRQYLVALAGNSESPLDALGGVALETLRRPRENGLPHELMAGTTPGKVLRVEVHSITAGLDHGRWLLLLRDMTREREVERHLEQQGRLALLGQLAGGLAHDLNNLLVAVISYPEMLLQRGDLEPQVRQALQTIAQQGRLSANLVRQLLEFSRHSEGEQAPLRVGPYLGRVAGILERMLPESIRIPLDVDVAAAGGAIVADTTQLHQMLMNVAVNARDAMPSGGTLTLGLHRREVVAEERMAVGSVHPGPWLEIAVTDTGSGIAAAHVPHIFEPFFTTKPPGSGIGIGLAQVHSLIEQHGGAIAVESQLGQGTTFRLLFPEHLGEVAETEAEVRELQRGDAETVLLVEDERFVRTATREALEMLGYRVVEAENGREALEKIPLIEHLDLVLTDVTMPEMSGPELVRQIHERWPEVKTVAITGYSAEGVLRELRDAGVQEIAQKPLSLDELAAVLRRVLHAGRHLRSRPCQQAVARRAASYASRLEKVVNLPCSPSTPWGTTGVLELVAIPPMRVRNAAMGCRSGRPRIRRGSKLEEKRRTTRGGSLARLLSTRSSTR